METAPHLTPVIVGIGEISEHGIDPKAGREPVAMMEAALRAAQKDCGAARALTDMDSLDVVMPMSWRYEDLAGAVCARIGASPAHAALGPSGGESPLRYIHNAAKRIASGDASIAAVVGGEAQETLSALQRAGHMPDWTAFASGGPNFADVGDAIDPLAAQHGLYLPIHVYGFYENAFSKSEGQTPAQSMARSAALWERYSAAAAGNPHSKIKTPLTAAQIATPTPKNRMAGGPYTKSIVANMSVNQAAAVIIMSLSAARAAGVPDEQCVHISAGAFADEPRNFLHRGRYDISAAQEQVLSHMATLGHDAGALELYSCFPVVPKMAAKTLGLPETFTPSVTGGMSFFGAPLNNYMTHAACAMVRAIRAGVPCGMLYGQGEYMTKHYGLRLSKSAEEFDIFAGDLQSRADAVRCPAPVLTERIQGPAEILTYTTFWNRDNTPEKAVAIVQAQSGERTLVTIAAKHESFEMFTREDRYPIGDIITLDENGKIA